MLLSRNDSDLEHFPGPDFLSRSDGSSGVQFQKTRRLPRRSSRTGVTKGPNDANDFYRLLLDGRRTLVGCRCESNETEEIDAIECAERL